MFRIYHSNALDVLKDLLVELIRLDPLTDPFAQETILVQSPGMAQWLKLELAQAQGIAASVDFPLPASFLWKSFSEVLEGVPERSAFNKEAMTWKLMELLPSELDQPEFSDLQRYLAADQGNFKLYQLCGKIADTFDQYLVYRPDWIADWEQGGQLAAETQPWQPVLWRALVERTRDSGQAHWHRANMFSEFVSALGRARGQAGLPTRLFVFGISALPQNYLEALNAMGQKIDVHLMVTNPCRYYWGEILDQGQIARLNRSWFDKPGTDLGNYFEHGNPLLASMGKLGRDYLVQLQELKAPEIEAFADIDRDSLLHQMQADILDLDDRARFPTQPDGFQQSVHKTPINADDTSIQLHGCHSPMREVEVLHDQLLAMFQAQPELSPRDVIVMMPDVATYAPYVDAIFGNAPPDRYIPFSISDRSAQQENPLLQSFLRFIALANSRLTVSEVLELLEVPAVMRCFGLDQEGFHRIRHWVAEVNIRWGLDSNQRSQWDLPEFEQNSWQFGLQRMLAGYALGDSDDLWSGIAPYGEVEGLEADLLGKLADFVDLLGFCTERFKGEQTPESWIELINELLVRSYQPDELDEVALDQVRKVLAQLQEQISDAGWSAPLSIEVLCDYLNNGLDSARSSQRFMVGAVNFCTLMPMRSIPFNVVCLLGMNDGDYPRTMPPIGFDLMADQVRRGDRSRRDDDRYLFLEAVLSAREKLYVSYVARSIHDNTEKVPSVLVSELVEYLAQAYVMPHNVDLDMDSSAEALKTALLTEHPLAPFSRDYFSVDSDYFSYASEWLVAAAAEQQTPASFVSAPLESDTPTELELSDLLRFFRNPSRYFFTQRLKVHFETRESGAEDDEPFKVEGLDDYQLKQRYLATALAGESLDQVDAWIQAEGLLPVGQSGYQSLNKVRKDCSELAEKLEPLMTETARRREIRIKFPNLTKLRLTGWQDGWHGSTLLRYRPAQVQGYDRLFGWIEHLCACACFGDTQATIHRGLSAQLTFHPLSRDEATQKLEVLVNLYLEGLQRPLAFEPGVGWAYLSVLEKGEDRARVAAQTRFEGGFNSYGAIEDPYLRRVYPQYSAFEPGLVPLTEQVLAPMLPWLEEGKE
ncbi:exodeoxyribonuclease V subunit gamma [Pontibacterium sp. N1Y112]|uniref:RecBCD enzyme subunit RecC n=1 Tax=Pontibacterium sinense TaxID=2781979 RepID=A0A8J7FD45_9GAMM|nr:exodeoxyribonuclease V subunit gamma [Pontibacterium sinense]MBE9397491.1 exodeoxyribonuclease V subunit gamma [Pontibacterium sinense]